MRSSLFSAAIVYMTKEIKYIGLGYSVFWQRES